MTKDKKKNKASKAERRMAKAREQTAALLKNADKISKKRAGKANVGAVTSISTAPVAIGNSLTGSETRVTNTAKGVVLRGRDFMFGPVGSGTVVSWTLCGGTPLSPACFANTTIGNYMRMYAKFRFKWIVAHYITSSPTSATGDIMFYYGKDRTSVFLNQTSSQLLGFVLSDPSTVIGPQWTNHSALIKVTGDWKLTDYGMHTGIEEYADGELFLLSKTNTADSPGYVVFDYEVEFAEHSLQPRLLTFPIPRIQYYQTSLGFAATGTGGLSTLSVPAVLRGNNISGAVATLPTGVVVGDIFKCIFDVTNSDPTGSWTNANAADLLTNQMAYGVSVAVPLSDGFTCYAMYLGSNKFGFAPTIEGFLAEGVATGAGYCWKNASITFSLQCWLSYVHTLSTSNNVPNY